MKNIKKILFACILALTVLAVTACGSSAAEEDYSVNDWALEMAAGNYFQQVIEMDDATLDANISNFEYEQNVPLANGYNSWKSSKKELGAFNEITDMSVEYGKNGAPTVTLLANFEKRDCEFIIGLDSRMQEITELTFNPVYTLGEKLQQAGTNLVIGMGTVFVVLIFLAWIISLFKYVHKAEESLEKKKAAKAAPAAPAKAEAPKAAPAASVTPVPGVTITPAPADDELKAVIAAAIAAYEEDAGSSIEKQAPLNNGIVVKSFKRG